MSRRWSNPAAPRARETRVCACGTPTRDGAYVCQPCLDRYAADLRVLAPTATDPGLWLDLRSVMAGERGIDYRALGGTTGGTRVSGDDDRDGVGAGSYVETGLVLDERAVAVSRRLHQLLERLVRLSLRLRLPHGAPAGWVPRSGHVVPAMAEWLLWRVDAVAWHPELAALVDELGRVVDRAQAIVMPPPHLQWLGSCPVTDGCTGSMRAARDAAYATCTTCGEHVPAADLRDWLIGHLADEVAPLDVIAEWYEPEWIAERKRVRRRLRDWSRQGRLLGWPRCSDWRPGVCPWPNPERGRHATDTELAGEPLIFRVGDAFDLLTQYDAQHDTATHDETRRSA